MSVNNPAGVTTTMSPSLPAHLRPAQNDIKPSEERKPTNGAENAQPINAAYLDALAAEAEWARRREREREDALMAQRLAEEWANENAAQENQDRRLAEALQRLEERGGGRQQIDQDALERLLAGQAWDEDEGGESDDEEAEREAERVAEREAEREREVRREEEEASREYAQLVYDEMCREEQARRMQRDESEAQDRLIAEQMTEQEREQAKREEAENRTNECYVCLEYENVESLQCQHKVHIACVKAHIRHTTGKRGGEIEFSAARCGQCRAWIEHPDLNSQIRPIKSLYERVGAMAAQRYQKESAGCSLALAGSSSQSEEDLIDALLKQFVYFSCAQCSTPFYGGRRVCQQLEGPDAAKLRVCAMCANQAQAGKAHCAVRGHGTTYIQFKCRYCCLPATYFCFGTTHTCKSCHDRGAWRHPPKPCPGPPACKGNHPSNDGEEHCLGCGLCRDPDTH